MASIVAKLTRGAFTPDKDIPDLSGKVILVTGGNNGLGKESILRLVKHSPAKVYLGARNEKTAEAAIVEIKQAVPEANITFVKTDLADFDSIKKAANTILADTDRLDILMNNAGIMATPAGLTKQGYELQFGTNHMGHALLTKLLLPILEKTAKTPGSDVRIVNLSSVAHGWGPKSGLVLDEAKTEMAQYSTWQRYGHSKLANVFFSQALAQRYPDIKTVAVHPGSVNTGLTNGPKQSYAAVSWVFDVAATLFGVNVEEGALNQLWASAAKSEDVKSGHFYYPVGKDHAGNALVRDPKLSELLWDWTEKELKDHGF
ncbi:putative retinol dehydrogenase [Phaeomoniella chlamydospora]|uniref:Putative retinol dehydrogenase n=1 Tax=Phaeomoniella chlamydospora TaxID=158046 RepID=A0A0G2F272_PHACM|nr:putative retinol dehydrogenase [Phaeomoniella chlamydospora]